MYWLAENRVPNAGLTSLAESDRKIALDRYRILQITFLGCFANGRYQAIAVIDSGAGYFLERIFRAVDPAGI